MKIIELTRTEAARLMNDLEQLLDDDRQWRTAKFNVDSHGLKWKIGEGMWTGSYGHDLNAEPPRHTTCPDCNRTQGYDGHAYAPCGKAPR